MPLRKVNPGSPAVGLMAGVGCGFGIGWGFGGSPLGIGGLMAGGGCGLMMGLMYGYGVGFGSQYINVSPEFLEAKTHRPNPIQAVQYAIKRITTLTTTPPAKENPH